MDVCWCRCCCKKKFISPTFLIGHRALSRNLLIWKRALSRHLFGVVHFFRVPSREKKALGGIVGTWESEKKKQYRRYYNTNQSAPVVPPIAFQKSTVGGTTGVGKLCMGGTTIKYLGGRYHGLDVGGTTMFFKKICGRYQKWEVPCHQRNKMVGGTMKSEKDGGRYQKRVGGTTGLRKNGGKYQMIKIKGWEVPKMVGGTTTSRDVPWEVPQ